MTIEELRKKAKGHWSLSQAEAELLLDIAEAAKRYKNAADLPAPLLPTARAQEDLWAALSRLEAGT